MMYNLIQSLKTNKQKITYLVLAGMLTVSVVVMVGASHVAEAATPSVTHTVTAYKKDGTAVTDSPAGAKAYRKAIVVTDTANASGTTWKYKWIDSDDSCDYGSGFNTKAGKSFTLSLNSESFNDRKLCTEATKGDDGTNTAETTITGIDKRKPNPPSNLDLASEDDTPETKNDDNITKKKEDITITGCAEDSAKVTVYVGGTKQGAAANANGDTCTNGNDAAGKGWTKDITLTQGTHKITAEATDAAGNISSSSSTISTGRLSIQVDTTLPTVSYGTPVVTGSTYKSSENIYYLNEGDTVQVSMTFADGNSGSGVDGMAQPIVQFMDGTGELGSAITAPGTKKTRTATYTVATGVTVTIAEGLGYKITNHGSLQDVAGNALAEQSVIAINDYEIDTTAPTITISPAISVSSGSTEWAVADETITVTVTFSEEVRESDTAIKYKIGSGQEKTFTYGSGQAESGKCRIDSSVTTGTGYECTYTVPSAGVNGLFKAKVASYKDYAGNSGTATAYNTTGIVVDTSIAAPSVITLKNNTKARDNQTSPTFIVTVAEKGGSVILYSDSECSRFRSNQ